MWPDIFSISAVKRNYLGCSGILSLDSSIFSGVRGPLMRETEFSCGCNIERDDSSARGERSVGLSGQACLHVIILACVMHKVS